MSDEYLVVGGGIAGIACATALTEANLPVLVRDRGHRLGGRMAVTTVDDRPIDVGASYFTVSVPSFRRVVDDWVVRDLARPWTDTFHLATPDGLLGTTTGPMRFAAPLGLRSLVEDLATGLPVDHRDDAADVEPGPRVDGVEYAGVALAMPGPQALDLLSDGLVDERRAADATWEPCIAVVATFPERTWRPIDGVFVNDSTVLTFIADDGRRRGDDAPVLVAHVHPLLSAAHLDHPESVTERAVEHLQQVLDIRATPVAAFAKRWSLAKPLQARPEPYFLGGSGVGLCGDGWHGPSRIEAAFLSGRALGRAFAALG